MRVIVGGLLVAGVVVCGNVFADEATKPSAVDYNNPANQWHGDSANPATAQTANYSNQNRDLTKSGIYAKNWAGKGAASGSLS